MIALVACPICPCDELRVIKGSVPVAPGAAVQFEMHYGDETYDGCDLYWYVDEIEGGNETVGTISKCGLYTAPTKPTLASVAIYGGEYQIYGCHDCCPGSAREITLLQ